MRKIPEVCSNSLHKAFNLNPVAMLLIEPDQTIVRVNLAFCRLSGYAFQDLEGHALSAFPAISEVFAKLPPPVSQHEAATTAWHDTVIRGTDDRTRAIRTCVEQIWDESGRVTHLLWMLEDIEDRLRADTELKAQQDQLRYLTQKHITAQEEERRRIARELHDEWGQVLSSMKVDFHLLDSQPDDIAERINAKIDRLILSSRQLSRSLRPALLDQHGLRPALENLASDFRRDLTIELEATLSDRRFAEALEITCFRLIQESLTNVRRHACAGNVKICIDALEGFLNISVIDDGQGFDPEATLSEASRKGSAGLVGMMERVRAQGGISSIFSRPGRGTRITARLPIDGAVAAETSLGAAGQEHGK